MTCLGKWIGLLLAGVSGPALACGFHNYAPQDTLVDTLLTSGQVVEAEIDPENPRHFVITHILAGNPDLAELPLLVDGTTRNRLSRAPGNAVLYARDGSYGNWQRLAYLDGDMRPVVEQIVARLPDWALGDDADRVQMFSELVDHRNSDVRRIALLELDRIGYAELKALNLHPDAGKLLAGLDDIDQFDLMPIKLLLLGFSGDDQADQALTQGFERILASEHRLLGAYATAMIELGGADGAAALSARLGDPAMPRAVGEMIVEALAIHRSVGNPQLRNAIDAAVTASLIAAPELAPAVARQFGARNLWSQKDALRALLDRQMFRSPVDLIAVSQYVVLANDGALPGGRSPGGN